MMLLAQLGRQAYTRSINGPCSGIRRRNRCCQQCSNIFSSENSLANQSKFHAEPSWEGVTKGCINDRDGHHAHIWWILLKSSSPGPEVL